MRSMMFGIVGLAMAASPSAHADNADIDAMISQLITAHMQHLVISYACRDAIGGITYFHSARSRLEQTATMMGLDRDEAVVMAGQAAESAKNSADAEDIAIDRNDIEMVGRCLDQLNEASDRVRLAQAEARIAMRSGSQE